MKTKPLPEGLPPLPEGAVYLGSGGEFDNGMSRFDGWTAQFSDLEWEYGFGFGGGVSVWHYAAPADSDIARLNGLAAPNPKQPISQTNSVRDWLNGRALPFTVTPEILDVMEEMWKLGAERSGNHSDENN